MSNTISSPEAASLSAALEPDTPSPRRRLRACHECDLLVALPPLQGGRRAQCPRCRHILVRRHHHPAQRSLALASAALVTLGLAVSFPFVGFEIRGIGNHIQLTETASSLIGFDEPLVGILVLLTIAVLPACYLLGVVWLQIGLLRRQPLPRSRAIARSLTYLMPWMMADVFVIGALVSLIKVAGLAQIALGGSFWAFCGFAVLLLMTNQSLDRDWLWFSLAGEPLAPPGVRTGEAAAPQGLAGCHTCGLVNEVDKRGRGQCRRCGEHLHVREPYSLQRTWALLIAASVLYIPANVYPIMTTTTLGDEAASTIVGGVLLFLAGGDWPIALVIFTASVIVPIGKIIALAWLCLRTKRAGERLSNLQRVRLYRLTEFIGRWSMVDVFVVAIMVALSRAGVLMSIAPGPAALSFGAVVVLTMLAAMSFDPRLLWDAPKSHKKDVVDE